VNKDLVDIRLIDNKELIINPTHNLVNINMVETNKITYPLSFIDAVNKKQLDLETGFFRDPNSGKYPK